MASAAVSSFLLPHAATLCPPPLHIQKKTRRTFVRRHMLRKSTHNHVRSVQGPLDDIIDEIKSDIWESPPEYSANPAFLNWANPLKAPSTWIVTPLPVSRAPSDRPLTIRKNRNSRSSTSDSSIGDSMSCSRNNSQDEATNGGLVSTTRSPETAPWPSFEPNFPAAPSSTAISAESSTLQPNLNDMVGTQAEPAKPRHTSSLRMFTNRFARLRRTRTDETSVGTSATHESYSTTGTSPLTSPVEASDQISMNEPTDEAVEAYMKRNAHNCSQLCAIMERMAERLPTPLEGQHDLLEDPAREADELPSTLRATIKTFPQAKVLTEEQQDIGVVIEIEGVLHNRNTLVNTTVDVIFIIDNGYYITKHCLEQATDAVKGALSHLRRGDRLALYTTHCAHNPVTGNKPEKHCPMRPFGSDSEQLFQDLIAQITKCGTQVWEPARPNPSMTEVVLAVAETLKDQDLKQGRTHIILLSSAAHVLHDVSKTFPNLYIHCINPACLPYLREGNWLDTVCFKDCCKNIFVSNWASYQSVPGRVKRILEDARSRFPVGELTNISIDVRTREGCELIECLGSKEVSHLRLGQVHTFFIRIRVNRNRTQGVDLDSVNPVFNSSLDVKGLRQELRNAVAVGAIKAHIFDIQLYYRNSINNIDCWNYTETPLTLIRDLGGLAPPFDNTLEFYKRLYFLGLVHLTTDEAGLQADELPGVLDNKAVRDLFKRLAKEINCQEAIRKYEREYRQKLPLCPGPIDVVASHEWLQELWNKKKNKRNGVAGVRAGTTGLADSFNGLTYHA